MIRIRILPLIALLMLVLVLGSTDLRAASIADAAQQLENSRKQKEKELKNLQELENIIESEIGTAKAQLAQSVTSTVPKIGKVKSDPSGLVTIAGPVTHRPNGGWTLDANKLRKEYELAGIYTKDEIDDIVGFHESYNQNQGFTTEIAEHLAKIAEGKAQQRTLQKYIERKKQEIREIENALTGPSPDEGGGGDGGGGGGGGY
ncbi:MAG: hypothetical protein ACOWWM_17920 [Desulfobacterales bacterium]